MHSPTDSYGGSTAVDIPVEPSTPPSKLTQLVFLDSSPESEGSDRYSVLSASVISSESNFSSQSTLVELAPPSKAPTDYVIMSATISSLTTVTIHPECMTPPMPDEPDPTVAPEHDPTVAPEHDPTAEPEPAILSAKILAHVKEAIGSILVGLKEKEAELLTLRFAEQKIAHDAAMEQIIQQLQDVLQQSKATAKEFAD